MNFYFLCMYFNPIKDWFYFSSRQRKGILVLISLIIIISVAGQLVESRMYGKGVDQESLFSELKAFEEHLAWLNESTKQHDRNSTLAENFNRNRRSESIQLKPVMFEPNTISQKDWENMGVPGYLARTIGNYLAAGGSFRYKEDLLRIYLMDDEIYQALEDYIMLPARPLKSSGNKITGNKMDHYTTKTPGSSLANEGEEIFTKEPVATTGPLVININLADTTELQKIRGIGQVFSSRIVRYRELLGGYYCTTQLLEVFGIDSTRFEQIRTHVTVDGNGIRKLNLNQAEFGDLVRHPYIDRKTANAILTLRAQHGPFVSADQVMQSYIIDKSTWEKISHYVYVNEPGIAKSM